jgi:hypothetical protein
MTGLAPGLRLLVAFLFLNWPRLGRCIHVLHCVAWPMAGGLAPGCVSAHDTPLHFPFIFSTLALLDLALVCFTQRHEELGACASEGGD